MSHIGLLLLLVAALTGANAQHGVAVPGWLFIALGALAFVFLILLAIPISRRWVVAWVLPPVREEAIPRLLDLVTNPRKLAEGLVGILLLNAANTGALWCATRAFGGTVDIVAVALVYLGGSAIGSVAPTPGGLGAMELALSIWTYRRWYADGISRQRRPAVPAMHLLAAGAAGLARFPLAAAPGCAVIRP